MRRETYRVFSACLEYRAFTHELSPETQHADGCRKLIMSSHRPSSLPHKCPSSCFVPGLPPSALGRLLLCCHPSLPAKSGPFSIANYLPNSDLELPQGPLPQRAVTQPTLFQGRSEEERRKKAKLYEGRSVGTANRDNATTRVVSDRIDTELLKRKTLQDCD